VRNSFIYTTASTNINSFTPSLCTFIYIYIKNPFNFNFILLNYLIKSILTFIIFILLSFISQTTLSPYNWSITTYNCPLMTTYKLIFKLSAMLVSFYLNDITINNNTTALNNIILNLSCLL